MTISTPSRGLQRRPTGIDSEVCSDGCGKLVFDSGSRFDSLVKLSILPPHPLTLSRLVRKIPITHLHLVVLCYMVR